MPDENSCTPTRTNSESFASCSGDLCIKPGAMGLPVKTKELMLQEISWQQYLTGVTGLSFAYYVFVVSVYCRTEFAALIRRFTGRAAPVPPRTGQTALPAVSVMGLAVPEPEDAEDDDLVFGEPEYDDEEQAPASSPRETALPPTDENEEEYLQMADEVTTLYTVVKESGESKANFEMVFRLLAQKYAGLAGTPYREQINDHLLAQGAWPFPLSAAELNQFWKS